MFRPTFLCLIILCGAIASSMGQDTNPFDLKWKKRDSLPAADTLLPQSGPERTTLPPPADPDSLLSMPGDTQAAHLAGEPGEINAEPAEAIPSLEDHGELRDNEGSVAPQRDADGSAASIPDVKPPPDETEPAPGQSLDNPGLFLLVFGIAVFLMAWIVSTNRGFLRKVYRAAMNENFSSLMMREQRFNASQYIYYIVYFVFLLNAGMFLYLIAKYSGWEPLGRYQGLLVFIGLISAIYLGKHFTLRVLSGIFPVKEVLVHYNFNIVLYNILAGIALMPLNLLLAFGPEGLRQPLVILGAASIALLYLLQQFRGGVIGGNTIRENPFQFFIYLCAIEILPVLVVVKIFITD